MKLVFLFLTLTVLNSPALADGPSHTANQNSGVVKVYCADLGETKAYMPRLDVFLNDKKYGYLEEGLSLTAYVPAGKQSIEVKGGDHFRKSINFSVSRGFTFYILVENGSLRAVSEKRYERAENIHHLRNGPSRKKSFSLRPCPS